MVKNTSKLGLLLFIAWLWLPTGPSDVFITAYIINNYGMQVYLIGGLILIILLYNSIKGKTIQQKITNVKKEIRGLF